MRTIKTGSNSKDVKVFNRVLILNLIRKNGPIARYEAAERSGLTPPTVTVIVNDLIKHKIISEVGRGQSKGGRRPVMLELNPKAGYIFAVRIQHGEIVAALLDLASNILESRRQKLDTANPEEVVTAIGTSFDMVLTNTQIKKEQVLWCGVASPGLVNSYEGIVERSSNLIWGRVPLGRLLSQSLAGIPVHVENISNAAAFGEKMYGRGYGCPNLIYLNLSVGIGAGIISNHELFGGARGYAGEIGTVGVPHIHDAQDDTGMKYRPFEVLCGVRAIVEKVKAGVADEEFAKLGLAKNRITIEDILLSPLLELPETQRIIYDTSYLIGIKIAELINLFNTDMVILGGELTRAGNLLLDTVTQAVEENTLKEMSQSVKILISSMREDPPLMGVYALVLEKLFHAEEWTRRVI